MLFLHHEFGKEEKSLRCGRRGKPYRNRHYLRQTQSVCARERTRRPAVARNDVWRYSLTSGTQFQAFKSGGDVQADLALQAQRLQRDRIVGAADQHVAAGADTDRSAALRAGIVAGEITGSQTPYRRKPAPGQRGFLGNAEIDADFTNGRDVTILRHAVDAQHAAEIGDRADDEADAGPAAAFEHADLDAFLSVGASERRDQHGGGNAGKDDQTTHKENLRLKRRDAGKKNERARRLIA